MDLQQVYSGNLHLIWNSLLPAPDIRIIQNDGSIEKVDQTIQSIAWHYLSNIAQLTVSLVVLPITFVLSSVASLVDRVTVEKEGVYEERYTPKDFGFASSLFQDSGVGTEYDTSSLGGLGECDWNKVLKTTPQEVTNNGKKIGKITKGVTLKPGDKIEDLFVNIIDHPKVFAELLNSLGCTAYRISLERSVIEPTPGNFNEVAIQRYKEFFSALKEKGIEPWVTLHHFTNPQWFEDKGGFTQEENIDGFVEYSSHMVQEFSEITNWMTFNEPGIRGLEAYVREEHPPQKRDISLATQVIRNILVAHTKAYAAMKRINSELNIGITHQWLKFLPLGRNPIEKITAFFYTSLVHTPIYNFFKKGMLHIKVPFKANVQLYYADSTTQKVADFLGVQAYGFPRVKVGFNNGVPFPGARDKVHNFCIPWLGIGFTAGSTCPKGGSMQYFGPPDRPDDLNDVLDEAFSIPNSRIPKIGITETGADAKRMSHNETEIRLDNKAQAQSIEEIISVTERYDLTCLFIWTLNRHCEWLSGDMPHLGVTKLRNQGSRLEVEETEALVKIRELFMRMKAQVESTENVA